MHEVQENHEKRGAYSYGKLTMDIAQVIEKLKALNATLIVRGYNVTCRYSGNGNPPQEFYDVMKDLKKRKKEVLRYFAPNPCTELFDEAVWRISNVYIPNTLKYIQAKAPELERQIANTEDLLNKRWDRGDVKEFREILKSWTGLYLKAKEKYRYELTRKSSIPMAITL